MHPESNIHTKAVYSVGLCPPEKLIYGSPSVGLNPVATTLTLPTAKLNICLDFQCMNIPVKRQVARSRFV